MFKDGPQILRIKAGGHPENPLAVKTAVRAKNMAMRMESQKIPKRLDRDERPRNRTPFRNRLPKKHPQAFPNTATQFREKRTIIKKITPEDLGDAKDEMAMGDFSQNLSAHPFTKLHHPLLVAGRTEVVAFAGEGQKIFMAAFPTSDPGKAVTQNATVSITVDHRPQVGMVKPIGPLKALLINLFEILEMILNTLIIGRILRPTRAVETMLHRDWRGCGFFVRCHVETLGLLDSLHL
jgi:hypothetical protein